MSTQPDMANRNIVASADGDTIVLPTFEPLAPGFFKPVVTYDATAGALTTQRRDDRRNRACEREPRRLADDPGELSAFGVPDYDGVQL